MSGSKPLRDSTQQNDVLNNSLRCLKLLAIFISTDPEKTKKKWAMRQRGTHEITNYFDT